MFLTVKADYCGSSSGTGTGTNLSTLLFADNDGHALSVGIPLNGFYKASSVNTMGLPVGTLKQNVGLS